MTSLDRWKNRRAMAWLALAAGLAFPLLLLWVPGDALGVLIMPFYTFVTFIITSYFTFATLDDRWQKPKEPTPEP